MASIIPYSEGMWKSFKSKKRIGGKAILFQNRDEGVITSLSVSAFFFGGSFKNRLKMV